MFLKIIQLTAQGSFILREAKSQEVYLQIQEISREPLHSMILLTFCIFVQLPFAGAVFNHPLQFLLAIIFFPLKMTQVYQTG